MFTRNLALLIIAAGCLLPTARAGADETVDAAVWLIEQATLVHRDGRHNVLLRSLRQLEDPRLEPLFSELTQRRHPGLRIHGILGLAEIKDPPKLDMALVADIKDTAVQAQLLSAAIDSDLLTTADAEQLANWPGLDPAIRVLVAGKLVADGKKVDTSLLNEALASDNEALRAMATLLKLQIDQGDPIAMLKEVDVSESLGRDRVRALLLQTAMKYEFKVIGPWAMKMLNEEGLERAVAYQALRAALMFDVPEAVNAWMFRYDKAADNIAERLRLSMLALDIAKHVHPRIFQAMIDDDIEEIQQIGRVGMAIRDGKPIGEPIGKLVKLNNLLASRWALQYAVKLGEDEPAKVRPIFVALIEAAGDDEPRFRAQRLEHTVIATQKLFENDKEGAGLLRGMLKDSSVLVSEAMLMGLVRVTEGNPLPAVAAIDEDKSRTAAAMALVIKAKHSDKLTEDDVKQLSLIVRGGAGLLDPLRIQAAWAYLKHTQQDRVALATVLGGG
jgi:hypothetical protein